ncbi:MAG: hypothetical protein ACREYE_26890 [Gammaproteobacteria bacterium]
MKEILELASKVSTPLALGGLVAASVFIIFREIIARNPGLTAAIGGAILLNIISKLFVLALVAMILGFTGYVVNIVAQQPKLPPDSVTFNPPSGMLLRDVARMIAANEGHTAVFRNCTEAFLAAEVEAGTLTGKTSKDLIEALQYRVNSFRAPKEYRVEHLKDKGIYEIRCD